MFDKNAVFSDKPYSTKSFPPTPVLLFWNFIFELISLLPTWILALGNVDSNPLPTPNLLPWVKIKPWLRELPYFVKNLNSPEVLAYLSPFIAAYGVCTLDVSLKSKCIDDVTPLVLFALYKVTFSSLSAPTVKIFPSNVKLASAFKLPSPTAVVTLLSPSFAIVAGAPLSP